MPGIDSDDTDNNDKMCAKYDFLNSTLSVPCLVIEGTEKQSYWVDFQMADPQAISFDVTDFGKN